MEKEENKNNLKVILIIVSVIIIAIISFVLIKIFTTKNIELLVNNSKINLTYSSLDYKESQKSDSEAKIESKEDDITIKTYTNIDTEYEMLKEYKKMVYNGEEKQFNNITYMYYKNPSTNQLGVIAPISDKSYIEITISAKEGGNKTVEDIFNQKKVQNILESLKIDAI